MDKLLKRIDELRQGRGWTEYRLAQASGIPQSTISGWYSGEKSVNPSRKSLEKLTKIFEITLSFLFADEDEYTITLTAEQKEWLDLLAQMDNVTRARLMQFIVAMMSFKGTVASAGGSSSVEN